MPKFLPLIVSNEKFMYNSELSMGGIVLRDKRIQEVDASRFPSEPISQISFLRFHEPYFGDFFLWPLKHPCNSNGPITVLFNSSRCLKCIFAKNFAITGKFQNRQLPSQAEAM